MKTKLKNLKRSKKKKKRGDNASQEKIKSKILEFYRDNKPSCDNEVEDFSDFNDFNDCWTDNEGERKLIFQQFLDESKGNASTEAYRSIIKFFLFLKLFQDNYDNGEVKMCNELNNVITTTEKASRILKKAKNFYFLSSKCKVDAWKNCQIPPSYWRDVTIDVWKQIKEATEQPLEQQSGSS